MSYLERTARKLMPILNEIKKRMVPEKTLKDKLRRASGIINGGIKNKIETLDSALDDGLTEGDVSQNDTDSKK